MSLHAWAICLTNLAPIAIASYVTNQLTPTRALEDKLLYGEYRCFDAFWLANVHVHVDTACNNNGVS